LKNSKKKLKNIKFSSQLDFYMQNNFTGRIDNLNFGDGETISSTQTIRVARNTVAELSLYIYIEREMAYGALQSKKKS
jgi:hypothetical protein